MIEYSIELALYDYIPIILSATGLWYCAKCITHFSPEFGKLAKIALFFVVAGGFCKATWKLLIAGADINLMFLNNALFILMAPGFAFLAYSIWATRRLEAQNPVKATAWRCPASATLLFAIIAMTLALLFPDKKFWFFSLLLMMTVANLIFTWHAIRLSLTLNSKLAAALFALNIIGVFAMSGLARVGDSSEAFQWIAQFSNTATQGSLALAGWFLFRQTQPSMAGNDSLAGE